MEPVEYRFAPYRAPVPYVVLVLVLPLVAVVVAGLLLVHGHVPRDQALAGGGALACVLAGYILYKDNRLQPAGVLRLMPGRLVFTADASGPLHMTAEGVRDMVVSEQLLIVRQKHGRRLVLHVARLPIPVAEMQATLRHWVSHAAPHVAARFAEATEEAEQFEARRVQVARVAGRMQRVTGRLGWILKLFGG